jgi:integrase
VWRVTLPERSAYGIVSAFRQVCEVAVRWGDMTKNPVKLAGSNPPPPRGVQTFTLPEVDAIAAELGSVYGPMIRFAAATGMRPEEWIALERQDIDRAAGVARVARTRARGRTKTYGKTSASAREVPLSARAVAALDDVPARLDTRLVFAAPEGGPIGLDTFRSREWVPALEAAGLETPDRVAKKAGKRRSHRRIYDLRSTFASQALAAGVSVFELARIMGTSVRMIELHYGALLQGSGEAIRGKLDAYDEAQAEGSAEATT